MMLSSLVIQTGCDRAERRLSVFGRPGRDGAFGTGSFADTSPRNGCRIATMVAIWELAANAAASSVRVEIEYRFASTRSSTSISRTISFISTNSRCGEDCLYNDRRRSMISVARVPSFKTLLVASSASSTAGWSHGGKDCRW